MDDALKVEGTDYACATISKVACWAMKNFHDDKGRWSTEEELFEIMKVNYTNKIDLNQK